jgi:hypothetical protein
MNYKLDKIFNLSTWILLILFLIFMVVLGFNVRLQTDDLVLLNLYKSNSLIDAYTEFPFNFRLGSYSLFYLIFKPIHPVFLTLYIGLFYSSIFCFSLLLCQSTLKFYLAHFKLQSLTFANRIKISLYFLLFTFFYSETLSETWFWTNAILTYFLPFFIALYLTRYFFSVNYSWHHLLLLVIGNFYIGGASESFALTWFFVQFILLIHKFKLKEKYGLLLAVSMFTILPILLNYIASKITYRLNFESHSKTLHLNLFETLTTFLRHIDLMDVFAIFILMLLIIELKLKKWSTPLLFAKKQWLLVVLISFCISLSLNLIVFKTITPMRTFNVFNQICGLFLFLLSLNFNFFQIKSNVINYSIPFLISGTSVFYYYFYHQINLTNAHRIAYDKRIMDLKENKDENKIIILKPLPNPGITVYADITNDAFSYSNEQFKHYFGIKGNFKIK